MKVLLATQKPFAAKAVDGIVKILTDAGHEVVKLEKYAEQSDFVAAVADVEAMYEINKKKAALLYDEIDRNSMFIGTAVKEDRSLMNVCFVMAPGKEALQDEFFAFAKERGMVGIKGHRSVGGFRASLYNACSLEDVQALVDCMKEFEALKK